MQIISGGVSRLLTRSAVQPIDTALVKEHIGLTHNSDDALLSTIISAAISEVENRGGVALMEQTRRFYLPSSWSQKLSGNSFHLPFGPVRSIDSVSYIDSDGATQAYTDFRLASERYCHFGSQPINTVGDGEGAVSIDYTCGIGTTLAEIPEEWQVCVHQLCMRRYEFRDTVDGKSDKAWERAFQIQVMNAAGSEYYV